MQPLGCMTADLKASQRTWVEQAPDEAIVFVGGAVMQTSFIGVDVSKVELVISIDDQAAVSVANDASAITRWFASLPKDCSIAMESTERYHLLLAQLALQAGLNVYVPNAQNVFFMPRHWEPELKAMLWTA